MRTPQLIAALVMLVSTLAACNRAEPREEVQDAAAEVRAAAARAGEQMADGWITTKIQAQYFADDDIRARYINVTTRDGRVTLTGYVDDEDARRQAFEIAKNTDGVREVENRLVIGTAPREAFAAADEAESGASAPTGRVEDAARNVAATIDDARITTMIQAKYFLDNVVKGRRIDVDSRDGVVTLRGEVASEAERSQALLLARSTDGVRRVEDMLTVNAALATPATGR